MRTHDEVMQAAPSIAPPSPRLAAPFERQMLRHALDAQLRLLPYALGFFGVSLPVFLTTAAFAENRGWLVVSLILFAFNWAAFYVVHDWLKTKPDIQERVELRLPMQTGGGMLWSLAITQTSAFAVHSGPVSEILLVLCAGAAVAVMFFASPHLFSLLIVAPAAAVTPISALLSRSETRDSGMLALGGCALGLALALMLNRHLRGHFALAVERENLIEDREAALDDARRLTRSKSDIVATLSHEIRNGLSGVAHVLAGALGAGSRGAPSREQLAAALAAARDLVEVLDATLDSETAEAGRLSVAARPLNVVRLAQDMLLLHRPTASMKGIDIACEIDPALQQGGAALGDGARVRQILNNLVGNAVKYTVRGRVEIRLRPAGPGRVAFDVVDTGPGLTAEELTTAFEPFRRVARTGAGVPGAGLGLSLSVRLARLMKGDLLADSTPGVGSRFTLELPFDHAAEAIETAPAVTDLSCRPMRVLLAEDDALNAAMLRAVLEQLGHRVIHAQDGQRALEILRKTDVDLVILDGRMPVMDGPTTARAIRSLPGEQAHLPIIAVIGGDPEEAQALTAAGAGAVLRKPVTVSAVARAVAAAGEADPAPPVRAVA